MVKVLLEEFKADYNFKHPNGLTPLIAATQSGNNEIALLLLEQPDINIDVSLDSGISPMHFAVLNSNIDVIAKLTQLGLNADSENSVTNKDGCNPFLFAAKIGFYKGLEIMKVKNENCCSSDGSNALHWAAGSNSNSLKCIEILYNKFKVSPYKQNCRKQYPLHIAIEYRNDDSAIFLYDICPRCSYRSDDRNKTPKELAVSYGAVGFLAHAFPNESIINKINTNGNRRIEDAIQDAILRENIPDTSRLIAELANQKVVSSIFEKLIKAVLVIGSKQLLDTVIQATPDIKIFKFPHKKVLPHLVVQSGQYKLIPAISKLGFTFDEKDDMGNTSMSYAVTADDSKSMKKILNCRENTDNLLSLFQNAAQKAFEDRKNNCINALIKYQKKSKNQIRISGTYLCNNLNVISKDVNTAIQMGLDITIDDVCMAAQKSTPEVLTLILQHFCKENNSLKFRTIKKCLIISCNNYRLDNIMALQKLSDGEMNDYIEYLIEKIKKSNMKYSFWLIEALKSDENGLIKKKIQEIGNLLKNGIDISYSNESGIRKKMINILQDFPLNNMEIEYGLPFLHYAIQSNAIWALSCLQKNYDISHKFNGCAAYDFLPFSEHTLSKSFWDSPEINEVLDSLTFNFSEICVYLGCSSKFISILCKTVVKKLKYLKNTALLSILIRSKASINDLEPIIISKNNWCQSVDENGFTPLMHAIYVENYDLARLIINNIPPQNIEICNYSGNNALHLIILSSDKENRDLTDFAMELISKCPQILRMKNREGQTPSSLAAYKGHINLLASFGSFDYFDPELAIHSAASGNRVNVIKFLLNSDCASIRVDPNIRLQKTSHKNQDIGDNFLHTAAKYGSVEAFKELVKMGTNPIQINSKNIMPIEIALQSGNAKMIEFIISLPSLLNAPSQIKSRAITSCAIGSRKDIKGLDAMIKCGFPISSMHRVGYPLIHCAALSDNANSIHLVLNSDADILALSTSKMTVLHLCAMLNKSNALRVCLDWASFCLTQDEFNKWIEAKNEEGCTAMHLAAESNNENCIALLLAYGGKATSLNSKKLTPAQLAVVSNSLDALGILIQIENDTTYKGSYPLEYTEIVNEFQKQIKLKKIVIPQKLDTKTIEHISTFPKQVQKRLISIDSNIQTNDENDLYDNINLQEDFYKSFGKKYGSLAVEVIEKFASYPFSQIQLIKIIEENPKIISELIYIINNSDIEILGPIIPNIPINSMISFLNTIKKTINISSKCPTIWEWFNAYFTLPCNPTYICEANEIPLNDDFTDPFDDLIMNLNNTKCFIDLPLPKLPRLSVFTGKRCSMLAVKKALSMCTDKVLQIKSINDIPLNNQIISKIVQCSNNPKYFGNSLLWCRDGTIILDTIKNIKKDGSFLSCKPINHLDAYALLAIRAMFSGILISNVNDDFRKEKEDTRHMIINEALKLNPSDFSKVREWCAAGLLCSEQCGSKILEELCNLLSIKKCRYPIYYISVILYQE